jgi:nitronate monooxygenase
MHTPFTELVGVELPVVQAPMAGFVGSEVVAAVAQAGGLGSLPCALLGPDDVRAEVAAIRERTARPLNLNFFCHPDPSTDAAVLRAWLERLEPYYRELGLDLPTEEVDLGRLSFDGTAAEVVEEVRPAVVSFQFGLPDGALLDRVRATGAKVISTATTVAEARWLEEHGCDAVIAQGVEAGGHRGMFLTTDVSTQVGTLALVPQVVDAVSVPVVAAGGIADGRGVAAALALGAAAVQVGTAYLLCPEALTSAVHRDALAAAEADGTAVTNVLTGRPARALVTRVVAEVGPLSDAAPEFPLASVALMPLRAAAEARGATHFTSMWSGQAAALARQLPAAELTRLLAEDAADRLRALNTD